MGEPMEVDDPLWETVVNAKFDKKWDLLKPKIGELYVRDEVKLEDVQEAMKARYGFLATDTQYKYHFRKWGWKRSMTTSQKVKALKAVSTRANAGKSSTIILRGKEVDKQKLRRHLKDSMRRGESGLAGRPAVEESPRPLLIHNLVFGKTLFLPWSLPHQMMFALYGGNTLRTAPSPAISLSPGIVQVITPPNNNSGSPTGVPSPLSQLRNQQAAVHRANLLFRGQHSALINSLPRNDSRTTLKWLNQFWMFAYKTAKHWGRGPRVWDAPKLGFAVLNYSSLSPTANQAKIASSPLSESPRGSSTSENLTLPMPPALCQWSVHCAPENVLYERYDNAHLDPLPMNLEDQDPRDERTWQEWPEKWKKPDFPERLVQSLSTNEFSTVESQSLPVAISGPLASTVQDQNALLEESLGFAICGANHALVRELVEKMEAEKTISTQIYPFHLAASYLNGAKQCCLILQELCQGQIDARPSVCNDLGYTTLDSILLTILRSHSSLSPADVDQTFKRERRFPGEEVDICGRWDADSECYRQLLLCGRLSVPIEWKHKFCHTSTQAICHNLNHIGDLDPCLFQEYSELFVRRCELCGSKLQLNPIYQAVLVAAYLGECGLDGEDLFGMLAVILAIFFELVKTFESFQSVKTSGLEALRDIDYVPLSKIFLSNDPEEESVGCEHRKMNVFEFADSLQSSKWRQWTPRAKTGWELIRAVLKILPTNIGAHPCPCSLETRTVDPRIARLWGAIQTEFLTYRRLKSTHSWISENFNMETALLSLSSQDSELSVGAITDVPLMQPVCACGHFTSGRVGCIIPLAQDACVEYISNLGDDYGLCNIIEPAYVQQRRKVVM